MVLGMILQRFQLFDHQKYQLKIKETLSIKPDGFPHQGQAAAGPHPQRRGAGCRACQPERQVAEGRRSGAAAEPRHARDDPLRLQSRHDRGTGAHHRQFGRAQRVRHQARRPRCLCRQLADRGRRHHRQRFLQRRAARQCGEVRQMAGRGEAGRGLPASTTWSSAAATATGLRPSRRRRAISTSAWRRWAPAASCRAARPTRARISTASSRTGSGNSGRRSARR